MTDEEVYEILKLRSSENIYAYAKSIGLSTKHLGEILAKRRGVSYSLRFKMKLPQKPGVESGKIMPSINRRNSFTKAYAPGKERVKSKKIAEIPGEMVRQEMKKRLEESGMTLLAYCESIGLSQSYFNAILRGKDVPSERVAKMFGFKRELVTDFMGDEYMKYTRLEG